MVREIVDGILNSSCRYYYDILADNDFHTYEDDLGIVCEEDLLNEVYWESGASKICVILDNIVLKKGFSRYIYDYQENENIKNIENAAIIESELYQLAKEQGVSMFFAETIDIGNGVVAQERAEDDLTDVSLRRKFDDFLNSQTDKDQIKNLYDRLHDYISMVPLSELFYQYNIDDLEKLYDFLVEYDINDLHESNTGIFKDGKVKFFDFCGFNSLTSNLIKKRRR